MSKKFPEGWEKVQLSDVINDIGDGGTPSRKNLENFGGGIPWAIVDDIKFRISSTKETLSDVGLRSCSAKLWPPKTVILTTGASIGNVGLAEVLLATKQGITGIVCDDSHLFPEYLVRFFEFKRNFLNRIAQGSTFKEVRAPILQRLELMLPPLPEQRKIAAILSSVDNAIEKTKAVIEQTKAVKKGLMQELLTRGIPGRHKKFKKTPIGMIPEEWEVIVLGQHSKILSGGTPSTKNRKYWQGTIPWITSADILNLHEINPKKFITEEAIKESATNLIPKNSVIVVTRVGLGKVAINHVDLCISQDSQGVIPDRKIFSIEYLAYFLSVNAQEFITRNQGTAIKGVLKAELKSLKVPLPSFSEQQKISGILVSLDKRIEHNNRVLIELSTLKAALMQVLLTGEVRVKVYE